MSEIWELIDAARRKTGLLHERGREASIPQGMYHLAVETWVLNSRNALLLTRRHPAKPYGLMWECGGGSVVAGEDSRDAAVRELFEETGIRAAREKLLFLGDTPGSSWIMDTYLYRAEGAVPALRLQPEEVVDAVWVPLNAMAGWQARIVDGVWARYCRFERQIHDSMFRRLDE